jgi:hypothetical protein
MKKTTQKTKYKAALRHLDFCISTHENKDGLERLLHSIADDKRYAGANIYIADSARQLDRTYYKKLRTQLGEAGLITRMKIHHVPYKANLAVSRNYLASVSPSKYKLFLCDEDIITKKTDLFKMIAVLDGNKAIGVVGGAIITDGKTDFPEGDGKTLEANGVNFQKTPTLNEFVIVKKDLLKYVRYNPDSENPHRTFCSEVKRAPFEMVVVETSIKRVALENNNQNNNDESENKAPDGAGNGSPSKSTIQSENGGDAGGGNSSPGRKDEESKDKPTGGRQGRSGA